MPSQNVNHTRLTATSAPAIFLIAMSVSLLLSACSRPTQTVAAQQPPPPPFEYVDTWGSHGDGPGQFSKPIAMASDGESIIYIADAATGFVHKFAPSGEPRLSFQDDRTDMHPVDLAVDAGAAIYVADGRRATVAIFFSDGMRHRELRTNAISAERQSLRIAVDSYGTIYATAKSPYGVRKFNTALRHIGTWAASTPKVAKAAKNSAPAASSDNLIDDPSAIAVGPDGLIYVSESAQPQIKVYDSTGAPQRTLTVPAEVTDAQLTGLAINKKFIFAVSATRPSIYIWSLDGNYRMTQDLSTWVPGTGSAIPRKIAVTPANDLLLLDTAAARILRFHLHL